MGAVITLQRWRKRDGSIARTDHELLSAMRLSSRWRNVLRRQPSLLERGAAGSVERLAQGDAHRCSMTATAAAAPTGIASARDHVAPVLASSAPM